jgi:outer membrane protein OmpA-like peptidoglycan-associated protein
MRRLVVLGLIGLGVAAPALAQRAGKVEFGLLGAYTRFDRHYGLKSQLGGGGRLGYFLTDHLSIEVDGRLTQPSPAGGQAWMLFQGSASLVLNAGSDRQLAYVLGGYSYVDFRRAAPHHFLDHALHGALGHRLFLGSNAALRAEVRGLYAPSTRFDTGGTWAGHLQASLGVSFLMGGRPPRDTDGDGVWDRLDTCARTPAGAVVDPAGCPQDSDRDGVFNGLDACADTPADAQVGRTGCPTDADADAVPDGVDQCAATPPGATVDARGCTTDADLDGVPDGQDRCANTERGTAVTVEGCPADEDRDGVANPADRCPATPAGTEVDASGCTVSRDVDGDGVLDAQDRCPGTAAGANVDGSGCPVLFTPERPALVLRGVTFESGSANLRPESYQVLDVVANSLTGNPDARVEIAGHTDNTGSAAINLRLSQERAQAVLNYLASRGVNRFHMSARGYGATQPIAPNATPAGRAQNRRVELRRIH